MKSGRKLNADSIHLNVMSIRAGKRSMVAGEGHASVSQIFFHARAQCVTVPQGARAWKKIRKSNSGVRLYSAVQYCTVLQGKSFGFSIETRFVDAIRPSFLRSLAWCYPQGRISQQMMVYKQNTFYTKMNIYVKK